MKVLKAAKMRMEAGDASLRDTVAVLIDRVRKEGDEALKEFGRRFDGCERETFRVSPAEIQEAYDALTPEEIADLRAAAANIEAFAKAQKGSLCELKDFSPAPGIFLGHRIIPVDSCCCYVPGGGYPLYSTALMLGIPAKAAGVKRVAACSPVMKGTDRIHPKTLVAMDIAGVDEIYAVGGAQAVAAFSYGTEQIEPVCLIVGPGNAYVTEAKRQCYGKVGIDFVAGPSEVLVIADKGADPEIIAADLLAQSEHDLLAKGIVLATDETLGNRIAEAVEEQLKTLETAEKAAKSWEDFGEILVMDTLKEAAAYANAYAPEHLELNVEESDAAWMIEELVNYGSLFIGENTAEVFGDYASGTNHTLPTLSAAKYTGGVWVGTFLKVCTNQRLTPAAAQNMAPLVSRLARGEGLIAHAQAAEKRKEKK